MLEPNLAWIVQLFHRGESYRIVSCLPGFPTLSERTMVEFLCILMGVVAGMTIFASLLPKYSDRQKFSATEETTAADRILGLADQLNLISHRVAADVCAHSERVGNISDRLSTPDDVPEKVLATINEIIEANQAMQGQLVDAQKRIVQQSRTIEQASHQARTDALTGLYNRRALNEFVTSSLAQTSADSFTGFMLLDIDHFKEFNDNFGHTTGDAVLASFARSLSDYCGGLSYVARYGGEEFAVVLTASSMDELVSQAAAIRCYISEQTIFYEDLQLKITASAGLCSLLADDLCQTVYDRADKGLYQAKKSGRNCGYWLSSDGWLPFSALTAVPSTIADLKSISTQQRATERGVAKLAPPNQDSRSTSVPKEAIEVTAVSDSSAKLEEHAELELPVQTVQDLIPEPVQGDLGAQGEKAEVLDLKAFLGRLESSMGQLRKAELPGTAFMLEAIGLRHGHAVQAAASWSQAVQAVMQNLRGIDVPCIYRPYTLCVFLPSCSLDAGIARAAKIKRALLEAGARWNAAGACEKLAVGVASVGVAEENASFLNRLELALETAADSSPHEIVSHDGHTCHFLDT